MQGDRFQITAKPVHSQLNMYLSVPQINPRFGTNTLHNLHGYSLHIHCLTSLLKKLIVFLYLNFSGKIVHNWGAR